MAYLVIREKDKPPSRVPLMGTVTMGRALDCDICLRDAASSVRHCCVEPANESRREWAVVDLSSRNGTQIDNHRIDRHLLADGDTFTVGETRVQFHETGFVDERPEHPEIEFRSDAMEPVLMERAKARSRPLAKAVSPFKGDVKVERIRPKTGAARTIAFARQPAQPLPQPTVDLDVMQTGRKKRKVGVVWVGAIVAILAMLAWVAWYLFAFRSVAG